jgi:hypothetical protein
VVEGARLESVYRSKAYRGFESLSLRNTIEKLAVRLAFLFYRRQKLAFASNVKEKRQSCAATGFSIVLTLSFKGSRAIASNPEKFICLRYAKPTHYSFRLSHFPFGAYRKKASKKLPY